MHKGGDIHALIITIRDLKKASRALRDARYSIGLIFIAKNDLRENGEHEYGNL